MGVESLLKVVFGVLSVYRQNDNPSEEALIAIANRYTKNTVHFFILEPQVLSQNSIAALNTPIILNNTSKHLQWQTDTYIILSRNVSPVINYLQNASSTFRKDTPWILGFNGNIEVTELRTVFEVCFDQGILDVVAVTSEGSSANVYTYYPFRIGVVDESRCYNYNPVIIDVWMSSEFLRRTEMFSESKVDNAQKCITKALIFPHPFYLFYSDEDSASPTIKGSASVLFEILRTKINFTPEFFLLTSSPLQVKELIRIYTKAIAFGVPLLGKPDISHGTSLIYTCFSWCAPTLVNRLHGWETLSKPFSEHVWIAFTVTIVVMVVVTRLVLTCSNHNNSQLREYPSWLIVWEIVFEAALPAPKESKLRMFFMCFCLFVLVIGTAFKARLHVLMTTAASVRKMSTLSEVYDTELDLLLNLMSMGLVNRTFPKSFDEKRLKIPTKGRETYITKAYKFLNESTGAVLLSDDACYSMSAALGSGDEGHYKAYFIPECILSSGGLGFAYYYTSPFGDRVDRITTSLWESGIGSKYLSTSVPHDVARSETTAIRLRDMKAVFWVFLGGLAVSVCVFVGEIVLGRKKVRVTDQRSLITRNRARAPALVVRPGSGSPPPVSFM